MSKPMFKVRSYVPVMIALVALLVIDRALPVHAASEPVYAATPQTGKIAFGAVTHSSAGTADAVLTLTASARLILVTNSLDKEVELTWQGADAFYVPSLTSIVIDLGPNNLKAASGVVIGIYHLGVQPTVGKLGVSAL